MKKVEKGSVVVFKDSANGGKDSGYYKITSVKGGKVNLGSVFGKHIYYKGIPLEDVYEDEAGWYERWSHSETYMCM